MTITVGNTSNSSTFQYWLDRTNDLSSAMTNKVVTVDSNTATGNAAVNGTFTATTITANTIHGGNTTTTTVLSISSNVNILTTNGLTVGNSTVNVVITDTTLTISNSTVSTSANNNYITSNNISLGNSSVNTTANATQVTTSNISVGNTTQNVTVNSTSLAINGIPIPITLTVNVQTSGTGSQVLDYFNLSSHRAGEYLLTIKDNNANAHQVSKVIIIHDNGTSLVTDYGVLFTNNQLATFTASVNATSCILSVTPTVTNTQIKGIKSLVVV